MPETQGAGWGRNSFLHPKGGRDARLRRERDRSENGRDENKKEDSLIQIPSVLEVIRAVLTRGVGAVVLPFSPALEAEPPAQNEENPKAVAVESLVFEHIRVGVDPAVVAKPDDTRGEKRGEEKGVIKGSRRRAGLFRISTGGRRVIFCHAGTITLHLVQATWGWEPNLDPVRHRGDGLPVAASEQSNRGKSNYITPEGYARLRAEHQELWKVERPRVTHQVSVAAALGDRSENADYIYGKKRLREIDRRIRFLEKRMEALQVVEFDSSREGDRVFFGAWVTLEEESGDRVRYRVVGPDESDPANGFISMDSPVGRSLLGKSVGDELTVRRPKGGITYEIVAVAYVPTDPVPG